MAVSRMAVEILYSLLEEEEKIKQYPWWYLLVKLSTLVILMERADCKSVAVVSA